MLKRINLSVKRIWHDYTKFNCMGLLFIYDYNVIANTMCRNRDEAVPIYISQILNGAFTKITS